MLRLRCSCDPTRGRSCAACDGTLAELLIAHAEDERDYGPWAAPDDWQHGQDAYERQLARQFGDVA